MAPGDSPSGRAPIADLAGVGDGLRVALHDWLLRQDWMAGTARQVDEVGVQRIDVLDDTFPLVAWVVLRVATSSGGVDLVQQFVAIADHVPDRVPDAAVIGPVPGRRDGFVAWSALADPVAALELCRRVAPQVPMARCRPGGTTRSGARLDVDAHWCVEFFHRLEDGPNPDVEAATELGGLAASCRAPVGVWRRAGSDVAWAQAVRSPTQRAGDLVDELLGAVLRARPHRLPGVADVAPLRSLGAALAGFHVAAAARFGSRPAQVDDLRRRAGFEAIGVAASALGRFDEQVAGRLTALQDADLGRATRVHGSFDLDAPARTDGGWLIRGVSGGSGGSVGRWSAPAPPLWDLATFLLALEARVESVRRDVVADRTGDDLALAATSWLELASAAVVEGYVAEPGVAALLPADRAGRDALLTICSVLAAAARTSVTPPVVDLRALAAAGAVRPLDAPR